MLVLLYLVTLLCESAPPINDILIGSAGKQTLNRESPVQGHDNLSPTPLLRSVEQTTQIKALRCEPNYIQYSTQMLYLAPMPPKRYVDGQFGFRDTEY